MNDMNIDTDWLKDMAQKEDGKCISAGLRVTPGEFKLVAANPVTSTIFLGNPTKEVARIGADGIMRFTVEANDENAARFVEFIEQLISRRLNGVSVTEAAAVQTEPNKETE